MRYDKVRPGIFLRRLNRFLAEVELDGRTELCHVKNTGRLNGLLVPGTEAYVQSADTAGRKTAFDLIAVRRDGQVINVDSQIPNAVVEEALRDGRILQELSFLKREVTFEKSRFDFYAEYGEKKAFLEVKGVTQAASGTARFPDAPTERGIRHLKELCRCLEYGYEAYVVFVIPRKGIWRMEPDWATHAAFGEALVEAQQSGVRLLAYDCVVQPAGIVLDQEIPVVCR